MPDDALWPECLGTNADDPELLSFLLLRASTRANSLEDSLAGFLARKLWAVPEVRRVGVAKRRIAEGLVLAVWTLVSDDSRTTRHKVSDVEAEILRRFPDDRFEFHCRLDGDFAPELDTAMFEREAVSRFQ